MNATRPLGSLALLAALALPTRHAAAQVSPPTVLPPANAQALPGAASPIAPLLPPQLPPVSPGLPPPPPLAPAAAPNVAFSIQDVTASGVTAYTPDAIAPLIANLTGAAVPGARVEAARVALLNRYREDGYVYVTVDARVSAGHLRFVVTEGRIAEVKLDGDIGPAGTQVLRFLNHLTETRPINVAELERWLLLANDIPGVTVRSVVNAGNGAPGELTLIAQVERKPVSGQLQIDNRAYRHTGPVESLAIVDLNSFTEFGERTEVSLYNTFDGTDIFGQASTETFIGGSGLRLKLYGAAGDAAPTGAVLREQLKYNGRTVLFGGQLTYPVIRRRAQSLFVYGAFDASESLITTLSGVNGARAKTSFDSLRIVRAGADYTLFDVLLGPSRSASNAVSVRVSKGITGLGASTNGGGPTAGAFGSGNPELPRAGERVDFTKGFAQVSRVQTLFEPYADATIGLQQVFAAQISRDVLPPEEKFYLGGPHFNRGYYYGQVTGDNALSSSTELQLNTQLPKPFETGEAFSAQPYIFYDYGETWESQNVDLNHSIRSAGVGGRFYLTQFFEVDLEAVRRFTRAPNGTANETVHGTGLYWQVIGRF